MNIDKMLEVVADAAINAGALVRCAGYAIVLFCIVSPLIVLAV